MGKYHSMDRRRFLKITSGTIGVVGLAPLSLSGFQEMAEADTAPSEIKYRTLGRTGLKYTPLGFGAMRTSDPALIRQGVDMGINNIDTARGYMGGENERIVGEAIAGVRDQVHITTKIQHGSQVRMESDLNESLRALDTAHIDILLRHGMSSISDLGEEETREFLTKAKESGKARFVGFSTHRNMADLLRAAADDGLYDVVLAAYNFKHDDDMTEAVNYAADKGIGVIAMKTQAGGYDAASTAALNPHQAALRWVFSNENVTSAIPSMVTYQQLEENFGAMRKTFGFLDKKTLHRYGNAIDDKLCRMCDDCSGMCPHGVNVADLNRCVMYVDGYGDSDLGHSTYRELSASENADRCRDCDECVVQCTNGVNVAANMRRATEIFA
ncbi:MAG: aldo/keto reductase [Candidatus Marinimicrobia bacterium]|nr:aldo/keto reductase [Candidatus Neomarinimicrobiota bacterium]MCF7830302.1 aldo/keto reductase [Candidatus Neomarinimicrobiota bacterium]MCF7882443.1 aldo/keto reductase [Candidatus Neomarinimicrobiota bacterium]